MSSRVSKYIYKRGINNYVYILPLVIFFAVFIIYPIVNNIYIGFFDWDGLSAEKVWIGINNYIHMVTNRVFLISIRNNLIFLVFTVTLGSGFGFLLALLVKGKMSGINFFRSILFAPLLLSPVIVGHVFVSLFNASYGTINEFFRNIGLDFLVIDWLGDPRFVMYIIIAAAIWQSASFSFVLYLAGMQNIPKDLYESAKIDGANFFQSTTKITFPMLLSTHCSLIILGSIGSLKLFDLVYVMTRGGPAHSSEVISAHIFFENFKMNNTGYSSAVSIVVLTIAIIITYLQLSLYRRIKFE